MTHDKYSLATDDVAQLLILMRQTQANIPATRFVQAISGFHLGPSHRIRKNIDQVIDTYTALVPDPMNITTDTQHVSWSAALAARKAAVAVAFEEALATHKAELS